ncbi:hypothetical protein LTR85_004626 [Meristemomyces frigidus]|nr:hypothetical protein LTR85_004626 [Meristemomyces frigidus]
MRDPETEQLFIIMEFIEGQTLEAASPSLTSTERDDVFHQIREALVRLRKPPPADYLGCTGRKPLGDGIFISDPVDPARSGPFARQSEMNEAMLQRITEECAASYVSLLRTVMEDTLQGHRTGITHADLQPRNVMVRRAGGKPDGSGGSLKVTTIDWEMSGWHPEYWEFCSASVWGSSKPEWLEAVQKMTTVYSKEYLMLGLIRSTIFC